MEVQRVSVYDCESQTPKKADKKYAQRFWRERIEANFEGFMDWKEN